MFERLNEQENIGASVVPPRKIQTESDGIHRAVYARSGNLRTGCPRAIFHQDLQDREPRAVLRVEADGRTVRAEFFESTFSADEPRFLEEYVRAAKECGHVAVHYSELSFPEDYVIRKVGQIFDRMRLGGVEGDLHVHGFLFNGDGESRLIV